MKHPEFSREQEDWLCEVIGDWYLHWKGIIGPGEMLGFAKEKLKQIICNKENKSEVI